MQKNKIPVGEKFGKLKVLKESDFKIHNRVSVFCQCECGNYKSFTIQALKSGNSKSCGCIRKDDTAGRIHGLAKRGNKRHPLFTVWTNIKQRCYYKKAINYKDYGARGILICDIWLKGFVSFYNWAIENGWENGQEIDRINNDGNYEPSNCRIVDRKTNVRNRRSTIFIEYKGEIKPLAEWAEITGIKYTILTQRIHKLKMPIDKAFENKKHSRWQNQ